NSNALYEWKFLSNGKLILNQLKKRSLDSSWTYLINKDLLSLTASLKDSVKTFQYTLKKSPEQKAFQLSMKFSSRYVKRRGDDTVIVTKLILSQGKKRKVIESMQSITVFSQKKALHNDSIDFAIWGQFVGYIADTLVIDCDQYIEHNFYKKYPDTLHYITPVLYDTVIRIKVPIKEVTKIYTQREPFTSFTTGATIFALSAGLASAGGSLILHDRPISPHLGEASIITLLTIPVTFGLGLIYSTEKLHLKSDKPDAKLWKVERRLPRLQTKWYKKTLK
ncbi:MAG TPA: hypothetical protein VGM63_23340, partial [Mucilaginibacter sp.]